MALHHPFRIAKHWKKINYFLIIIQPVNQTDLSIPEAYPHTKKLDNKCSQQESFKIFSCWIGRERESKVDPLTGSVSLTSARSLLKVFFSKSGLRKTSPTSLKTDRKLEADFNCDTGSERLISTLIPEVRGWFQLWFQKWEVKDIFYTEVRS